MTNHPNRSMRGRRWVKLTLAEIITLLGAADFLADAIRHRTDVPVTTEGQALLDTLRSASEKLNGAKARWKDQPQ